VLRLFGSSLTLVVQPSHDSRPVLYLYSAFVQIPQSRACSTTWLLRLLRWPSSSLRSPRSEAVGTRPSSTSCVRFAIVCYEPLLPASILPQSNEGCVCARCDLSQEAIKLVFALLDLISDILFCLFAVGVPALSTGTGHFSDSLVRRTFELNSCSACCDRSLQWPCCPSCS
jgi:hypothetical protein